MENLPEGTPQERLFSFCQLFIEHVLFSFHDRFRAQLSTLQLRTLMCLREHGAQTMSELAERLIIPRQQMTQVVDRLTEMALVERQRDENDRRAIRIVWSRKGEALFSESIMRFWDDFYACVHMLPEQDARDFMNSTETLRRLLPQLSARRPVEGRNHQA